MRQIYIQKKNTAGNVLTALAKLENILEKKNYYCSENLIQAFILSRHIFFGTWKLRLNFNHLLRNFIALRSKKFLCLESPVIGRQGQHFTHLEDYFRVGINGIFADNGFEYAKVKNDRWQRIFAHKYPMAKLSGHFDPDIFGIVLQMPSDAAVKGVDMNKWHLELIQKLLIKTDAKIIVRTPPLLKNLSYYTKLEDERVSYERGTNENLKDFFDKISAQFSFSSTMGVDAFLLGIPSFVSSTKSFLYSSQKTHFDDFILGNFKFDDSLLHFLSNTTWSIEEFDSQDFEILILNKFLTD